MGAYKKSLLSIGFDELLHISHSFHVILVEERERRANMLANQINIKITKRKGD